MECCSGYTLLAYTGIEVVDRIAELVVGLAAQEQ